MTAPVALQPRAAMLRRGAEEALIPALLLALERRLTRAHGEWAVIRIRTIDLRLKLTPSDLASPDCAEALGEDIADQLLGMALIETASARSKHTDAPVRVWRDARQFTAARLAAAAQRQVGPNEVKESVDELLQALTLERPEEISSILTELAAVQELQAMLRQLTLPMLTTLMKAVSPRASPAIAKEIAKAIARHKPTAANPARRRPKPDMPDVRGVEQPHPESPPPQSEMHGEQVDDASPNQVQHNPSPKSTQSGRAVAQSRQPGQADDPQSPNSAPDSTPEAFNSPDPPRKAKSRAPTAYDEPRDEWAFASDDTDPDTNPPMPQSFPSSWCALAYLLPIILKTELPEALWQAGLDEGAVLCRTLALIAGGDADPATRILSRQFPDAPPPVGHVPDWARDEITTGALARAAALVGNRGEIVNRIETLHAWLAVRGGFDLAAWLAAYLLAIFEANSGFALVAGELGQCFARDGRIEIEDDVISIIQPLAAINITMRRAGLDADPGWLPWLEKRMVFVFEGDEDEA
ncbi:MAG: hypothetical protein ACRCS9_15730 [Hyphomicrobium sp.]